MKTLLPLLFVFTFLVSCSNSENEIPFDETKISLDSISISFMLDDQLIEMKSPNTTNSGWGTNVTPIYQGENIADVELHQTYRNDNYKVTLSFSKIVNGDHNNVNFSDYSLFELPLDVFKKEIYTNNQMNMKYVTYASDIYSQLELKHFDGFTIKIYDIKNDVYYTSKIESDKVTLDSNSSFSPTKHLEGSYVTIVKSELIDVIDIKEGISHAHGSYLTEVAFQTNLIKYTKDILNEIDYKGSVTLTDGKIIGLF